MATYKPGELEPLPRWIDDPNAYNKAWIKRKRKNNADFARNEAMKVREWQKANPLRAAWTGYRTNAKLKKLEFLLSQELFDTLLTAPCSYCGMPPNPINGIDRMDNTKGYIPDNVTTACQQCNYAKRTMSREEFLSWAKRVAEYKGGPSHRNV